MLWRRQDAIVNRSDKHIGVLSHNPTTDFSDYQFRFFSLHQPSQSLVILPFYFFDLLTYGREQFTEQIASSLAKECLPEEVLFERGTISFA
jgi:hypothetical protein